MQRLNIAEPEQNVEEAASSATKFEEP